MTHKEIDHWLDLLLDHTHDHWYRSLYIPARGVAHRGVLFCNICEEKTRDINEHYVRHEVIARTMRDCDLYPLGRGMRERVTLGQLSIFIDHIVTFDGVIARHRACVPRVYAIIAGESLLSDAQRTRALERAHDDPDFADAVKAAAEADGVTDFLRQQIGPCYAP